MSGPESRTAEAQSPAPYSHWMMREIHEQPATLTATLERYTAGKGFRAEVCAPLREWLRAAAGGIVIAASGSSRHAGLIGELLIEDHSGLAVDVEYASEYSYRSERAMKNASVLVVSQSGETADTLAALRRAKRTGQRTLAITNLETSTMAEEATVSFPTAAGRERAIPATKSFTAQLLNFFLLSLLAAEVRATMSAAGLRDLLVQASALPAHIERQLPAWEEGARRLAEEYRAANAFLFLGRGVHYPIAREGALKLKESAYVLAEGYPAGELKHGPNALVSADTPLIVIATVDRSDPDSAERYEKVVQLMRDLRRQGAGMIAIANKGDDTVAGVADHTIEIEPAAEALLPICEAIPLQLLAYFVAVGRGVDVDHPRHLTKAVLAE